MEFILSAINFWLLFALITAENNIHLYGRAVTASRHGEEGNLSSFFTLSRETNGRPTSSGAATLTQLMQHECG
jgi:hypothetical protein